MDQSSYWWRNSLIFELVDRTRGNSTILRTRARKGAEAFFDYYWKPHELVPWAYELVRRLPNCKVTLPSNKASQLRELPSYNLLTLFQKRCLIVLFQREYLADPPVLPVRVEGELTFLSESDPPKNWTCLLPQMLISGPSTAVCRMIKEFLDSRASNVSGPKSGRTRNKNQLYKSLNWHLVELLDQRANESNRDSRQKAINHAQRFLPLISTVHYVWKIEPEFVPWFRRVYPPLLTAKHFTQQDLDTALHRAKERIDHRQA